MSMRKGIVELGLRHSSGLSGIIRESLVVQSAFTTFKSPSVASSNRVEGVYLIRMMAYWTVIVSSVYRQE